MKIIVLQKNLKQGVFATSNITGKNQNLPILNNLMISAKDGVINLQATDLEMGIKTKIRGKIEKDGEFTVEAKTLASYINLLPNKKIDLEVDNNFLKVEAENYHTKIKGESAEEYPLIPELEKEEYISLKLSDFKSALSSVIFAVSHDENRLALSGVLFNITEDKLTMVGTDSYRLAERALPIENQSQAKEQQVIVPLKTLQELVRVIGGDFGDETDVSRIKIYLNENQIAFEIGQLEFVSRLINEQYPDYKQIIPDNFKTGCVLDREELVRAIKASSIFARTGINDVNLEVDKDKGVLVVSSESGQTGENRAELETKVEGSANDITMNYRYLLDGLQNIKTDTVKLEIVDNTTPCLFKPTAEAQDYLYIVMPIKK